MKTNRIDAYGYLGIALAVIVAFLFIPLSNNNKLVYLGAFILIMSIYYTLFIYFILEKEQGIKNDMLSQSQFFTPISVENRAKRKPTAPISGKCSICNENVMMPYRCSYCDRTFCSKHRLPENHKCDGLIKKN